MTPRTITSSEEDPLLTPAEVATRFRVDRKTVGRWVTERRIAAVRTPGGHRRFHESDVRRLLEANIDGDDTENALRYRLWSVKHAMWWRPAAVGYTAHERDAGTFSEEEAVRYVVRSALAGDLNAVTCMVVVKPTDGRVASTP